VFGMSGALGFDAELALGKGWSGFDLVKAGTQGPMTYRRGQLFLISGCITTVAPMKNAPNWDLEIGSCDPRCLPPRVVYFLMPTAMSRYEGIYQCGTSAALVQTSRGVKVTILFSKSMNPMVLHLSGFACSVDSSMDEESFHPLTIPRYEYCDWNAQKSRKPGERADDVAEASEAPCLVRPSETNPPGVRSCGNFALLQGELQEATYPFGACLVATLPDGLRPRREIRCVAYILVDNENTEKPWVKHTVALTIREDGSISAQGGKVQQVDQKGNMRLLHQKKKGKLTFDGVRFSLVDGVPVKPMDTAVGADVARPDVSEKVKQIGYLFADGRKEAYTAACIRQDDVVMLEGYLDFSTGRLPNPKQAIATLGRDCWPHRRETFFTRGGSDIEERRRIDIDKYGRIFCPEGARDGRVELSGIIFVAAEPRLDLRPHDPEWDDLKLQYQRNDTSVISTSFDGHELLEQFVRRSNEHEWKYFQYDCGRHAGRKMLLPLGQACLRGNKWDPMNIGQYKRIWNAYESALSSNFGVTTFHTLLHVSDGMFDRIASTVKMKEDDRKTLVDKRIKEREAWDANRQLGFAYEHLQCIASEVVDQMFEHWDFRSQLQGALQNDFRPPATIEHLFPARYGSGQDRLVKVALKDAPDQDWTKFEEIRQFFYLYETTGNNMTHCSLLGSQDIFTTTGKWHFPDSEHVQKQLFENIAWLFPRQLYLYISERQTLRFPFIEDLDIQARTDWQGPLPPGEAMRPPDDLIMHPPKKDAQGKVFGDPGELMRMRAKAIHMVYPHLDYLEVLVYSASGYNKGKDMLKSSFHLVWRQLIVDPDRAPIIRHATLGVFSQETQISGSYLARIQKRLLDLHESNNWELVFDSTTIHARNGLRLPYSDKASMVVDREEDKKRIKEGTLSKTKAFKKRVRENRPSKAIGVIRFEFDKDQETGNDILTSAQWIADADTYPIAHWIGLGSCRRDPNSVVDLTQWQLNQDVLAMLPRKPGEEFYFDNADGEGGHWVTHKPYDNIRRFNMKTADFVKQFSDALKEEQDALGEEQSHELLRRMIGSFVCVTDTQAIWRATAASQFDRKVPDKVWGTARMFDTKMRRAAEVIFLESCGKVIVTGPDETVDALLRTLSNITKVDDNAVQPIYDLEKLSK